MYHMKWERIRVLLSREWNWELGRCGITNKNGKSQNESYRYIEKSGSSRHACVKTSGVQRSVKDRTCAKLTTLMFWA